MIKKFTGILIIMMMFLYQAIAQDSSRTYKLAIFAPLYLDSAFDDDNDYRYNKNVFPKFINPGLEFYEGAQLALDSLNREGANLEVFIYDTRSTSQTLEQQLEAAERAGVKLIISHNTSQEARSFGDVALRSNIPVINANLPNETGISENPFYVILNPTLKTQAEGIYRYMQKYYPLNPIIVFRKKGPLEDRLKNFFDDYSKNTAGVPLNLKYVDLTDSFQLVQLRRHLDTTEQSLAVSGSLDENFGKRLVSQLAALKKQGYNSTVMGMPTWDGINFNKPEFKGIEIVYSTPFYHSKVDKVSQSITSHFNKTMFARPSDMVFRGYEVTLKYAKLLMQFGDDLGSNLGSKLFRVFTDFDVQPVLNRQNRSLDYFENKKLYFLKMQDGVLKGVNF
jgi:ABC-type branched-subunit amino acid transport system substrate-binding protein